MKKHYTTTILLAATLASSHAATTVFFDNFDNNAGGDGGGSGSFAEAWVVNGTLFGGAGTENSAAAQPSGSGHTDPNWAFFQTDGSNGSGIQINTGVATIANLGYTLSFLTGSKTTQLYTGTMTAQLWDWDGVGSLTSDGIQIGSLTGANNPASTITANSASFTSAGTTEGNIYVRFDLTANGSGAFAQPLIDNVAVIAVPEPSSAALLGLGGLALILRRRK